MDLEFVLNDINQYQKRQKDRIPDYTLDSPLTIRDELVIFPELAELEDERPLKTAGFTPMVDELRSCRKMGFITGSSIIKILAWLRCLVDCSNMTHLVTVSAESATRDAFNEFAPYSPHCGYTQLHKREVKDLETLNKSIFTEDSRLGLSHDVYTLLSALLSHDYEKLPLINTHLLCENGFTALVNAANHAEVHKGRPIPEEYMNLHYCDKVPGDQGYEFRLNFESCSEGINLLSMWLALELSESYVQALATLKGEDWAPSHEFEQHTLGMISEKILSSYATLAETHKKISFLFSIKKLVLKTEVWVDGVCIMKICNSKNMLTNIKDIFAQRRITLELVEERLRIPDLVLPSTSDLREIYLLGDLILALGGNDGFKVIKMFEVLALATLHLRSELATQFSQHSIFYDNMTQEAKSEAASLGVVCMCDRLIQILRFLSETELLEITGLYRQWGHPIIFVSKGLKKVHANCTKSVPSNPQLLRRLASDLQSLLLKSFHKKHGSWPPGTRYFGNSHILKKHIRCGTFPSQSMSIHLKEEWLKVEYDYIFDPTLPIPILELIGDKSHAVTRSALKKILAGRSLLTASASRRVLETLLESSSIDIRGLLAEIDKDGFDEDDLIILLREKERELKLEGRFFALMTFKLRCYFVATEWLMSEYIIPCLPEITVNHSQTELQHCLYRLSCEQDESSSVYQQIIHLDYEKWNNFQRYESTAEVFLVIDHALGYTNLVTRTHKIFQSCIIAYSGRLDKIPKDLSEQLPWCWRGQAGGLEGLRQKGWSIVGALLLRHAAREKNRSIRVLMQGDNQLVIIRFSKNFQMGDSGYLQEIFTVRKLALELLTHIQTLSGSIGLTIKPEETWISSGLLYYGKYPILYGASAGMYLKRLCRLFSTANELTPSIANLMSSVVTTALSAGVQKFTSIDLPQICWWYQLRIINSYMEYDPLLGRGLWKFFQSVSSHRQFRGWNPILSSVQYGILLRILLTEPSLGGIGGTLPLRFAVRQFPDPVCETLTCCLHGAKILNAGPIRNTLLAIGNPPLGTSKQLVSLLEDPTSLNIRKTIKPTNELRNLVLELLKDNRHTLVKNVDFYKALSVLDYNEEEFITSLFRIRPLVVKFLSNIYAASLYGVARSVIAKYIGTRTLVNLALNSTNINVRKTLTDCEMKLVNSLVVLCESTNLKPWECSYNRAQELRREGWGFEIVGITIPHPLEQFESLPVGTCCQEEQPSPHVVALASPLRLNRAGLVARGPFYPFLGSKTAEKRIGLTALEGDTKMLPIERIVRLLRESDWLYRSDSRMYEFLVRILKTFTDMNLDHLIQTYEILSGAIEHRYTSARISSGCFLSNGFTPATCVSLSTSSLGSLGRGGDNFLIVFQALFVHEIARFSTTLLLGGPAESRHLHIKCQSCIVPCSEISCEYQGAFPTMPSVDSLLGPIQKGVTIGGDGTTTFLDSRSCAIRVPPIIRLKRCRITDLHPNQVSRLVLLPLSVTLLSKSRYDLLGLDLSLRNVQLSILRMYRIPLLLRSIGDICILLQSYLHFQGGVVDALDFETQFYEWRDKSLMDSSSFIHEGVVRTLGNDKALVGDLVASSPVPLIGSYPLRRHDLFGLVNQYIKSSIESNNPHDWWKRIVKLADNIIIPFDLLAPALYIFLRYSHIWVRTGRQDSAYNSASRTKSFMSNNSSVPGLISYVSGSKIEGMEMVSCDLKTLSEYALKPQSNKLRESGGLRVWPARAVDITEHLVADPIQVWASPLNHFFRPILWSANGTYKILSILNQLPMEEYSRVGVFGDGNGGFSRAILQEYPHTKVLFSSLADFSDPVEQPDELSIPLCLIGLDAQEIKARVIAPYSTLQRETDMSRHKWVTDQLARAEGNLDLIISDAETYTRQTQDRILRNVVTLGTRTNCRRILYKTHLRQHESTIRRVQTLSHPWVIKNIWRSPFSNWGRLEVYIDLLLEEPRPLSAVSDLALITTNQGSFMISPQAQLSHFLSCPAPIQRERDCKPVVGRGIFLRPSLIGPLIGYTYSGYKRYFKDVPMASLFHSTVDDLCWVLFKEFPRRVMFRRGLDILDKSLIFSRSKVIHFLGMLIGVGICLSALSNNLEMYSRWLTIYSAEKIYAYSTTDDTPQLHFSLLQAHEGMCLSRASLKPTVHSTIRYLAAAWWSDHSKIQISCTALNRKFHLQLELNEVFLNEDATTEHIAIQPDIETAVVDDLPYYELS